MMQKICHFILFKILGWRMIGELPKADKYLFVAVPHTSNWDFVIGWLAIHAMNLDVKIFVKDVFFVWPLSYICRWFGVMPVNRRCSTNFVDSIAAMFDSHEQLKALITPEGTRSYKSTLKSGYYYLALKAGLPIVLAGSNFIEKTFTILESREPLSTFEKDEAQIIEFCKTQYGKYPDRSYR